jgi:mRNA interferase RelE/StbE
MYKIYFSEAAISSYVKFSANLRKRIDAKILLIAQDPYAKNNNTAPIYGRKHCYRLRIADIRVVYEIINNEMKIFVIKIGHRKEVYNEN